METIVFANNTGSQPIIKAATHLGIYGIIDFQGKILLVRKARGHNAGKWDLPGGHIKFGESFVEALWREIHEETGLSISAASITDTGSMVEVQQSSGEATELHHLALICTCSVVSDEGLYAGGNGQDVEGLGWFEPKIAIELGLTPFAKEQMEKKIQT